MPLHVAPISRRRFLFQAAAGAAGLLLAPSVFAARKPVDKHAFALFSDSHIAADGALVVRGTNMTQNLRAATSEVVALPELPAAMFLAGDCAYSTGQPGDYEALWQMMQPLSEAGLHLHLALGNHDHRENFSRLPGVVSRGNGVVVDKHVTLVQCPRANWFILDSLEHTNVTPGLLGSEQLEWLAHGLDAHRRKPALVLVHHNPGILGNLGLKDTVPLFDVIRSRRQVKACIYGHTHTWRLEQDTSGLHLVNLPALAYVFRQGEPSAWVHARLERDSMQLELRCLDTTRPDHGQQFTLRWRES